MIEFRTIEEKIPMNEFGMRQFSPGFGEWYMRIQPTRKIKQYRTKEIYKRGDGELDVTDWSEWKNM